MKEVDLDIKYQLVEQYIDRITSQINNQYRGLMDEDKIAKAKRLFTSSNYIGQFNNEEEFLQKVAPEIDELSQKVINDFIELQNQIEEMMKNITPDQNDELATLDMSTANDGIYLSQQQVDLLMITDINSKEELKNYIENICGQFPNQQATDVIEDLESITTEEQLEVAKRKLYQKYQDGLIDYLTNNEMSDVEKAKVKLERFGIIEEEQKQYLSMVAQGQVDEMIMSISEKYGRDFMTKINRYMNDDFENVKSVSYDEMKSLSELIKRDSSLDTIIIATGKFDNVNKQVMDGKEFDPYFNEKALEFCYTKGKHMRYHALFDHSHVDNLLKAGKGKEDHDSILSEMKAHVKLSMDFIEKNNRPLKDGTMLINEVEVFNELVEKNKKDKESPYEMVWEKYFGITTDEIMSCFEGIKKPNGVEWMYNETSLTESPNKRAKVEEVLFEIERNSPNFIDRFGDQMHLSEEDVMTKKGKMNLQQTAQMLKRIQDGNIIVNGKNVSISPKKTECTEHDFHFTKEFMSQIKPVQENRKEIEMWPLKRQMQNKISETYKQNGVSFERTTYWSLFGKDHNLCRANRAIQRENKERKKEGLPEKPYLHTLHAGIIKEGQTLKNIRSLKQTKTNEKNSYLKWSSPQEKQKYELIKTKNEVQKMKRNAQNQNKLQSNKPKVMTKTASSTQSKGFTNALLLTLLTAILSIVMYMLIKK